MSDIVQIRKNEWEAFMKENDRLIERYDVLLKKMKNLEDKSTDLEKKLQASESECVQLRQQLRKLEETSRTSIEDATVPVRKRLTIIESLLKESEGLQQ